MKRTYFLVVFLILPVIIAILLFFNMAAGPYLIGQTYKGFTIQKYKLEGKTYDFLVADTPQKWQNGLMYFKTLKGVAGMIFLFSDKQYRTFWNKNTYLDLDLYWLSDDRIVGKNHLPSIEKSGGIVFINSPEPVNRVIELSPR